MAKEAKITKVDRTFLRNMRQVLLYFSEFVTSQELASGFRLWHGHHVNEGGSTPQLLNLSDNVPFCPR
jgi:hypothetical protein